MIEIKFRAWDKEGNQYSNWKPQMIYHDEWALKVESSGSLMHPSYPSNRFIYMQFIGRLDDNGKEIYAGDIVRFLDGEITSSENGMECDEFQSIGVVEWENEKQGWDITNRTDVDWIDCWNEVEVIGNVFENPALLK